MTYMDTELPVVKTKEAVFWTMVLDLYEEAAKHDLARAILINKALCRAYERKSRPLVKGALVALRKLAGV